jgi:glycosyltransferase involved in cell wall biosynthesis
VLGGSTARILTTRGGAKWAWMTEPRSNRRPKLATAVTFPVHPPRGGGQVRIFHLFRELARIYDIELVTLGIPGTPARRIQLAPGLSETRIPKSAEHARQEFALEREAGTLVTDVAFSLLYRLTPDYLAALRSASRGARAVIASHPYPLPAILEVTDRPVWYEAQDVEALLKAEALAGADGASDLLEQVKRIERACCDRAEFIWACSSEDRSEFVARYGVGADRILVVPNGVALEELSYVPLPVRREHKRRLGIADSFLAVFLASWHAPNVLAAQELVEIARRQPSVEFLLVGSVGQALAGSEVPDNVDLAGMVASEFKRAALSIADLALNPVVTGSGTNLKMLDYFASGTPVVSTAFGARGLGVRAGEHYTLAEPDRFGEAVESVRKADEPVLTQIASAAQAHVEANMTWEAIVTNLLASLGSD